MFRTSPVGTGPAGPIGQLAAITPVAVPPVPAMTDECMGGNVLTWLRQMETHAQCHSSYYADRKRDVVEVDVLGETMKLPIDDYGSGGAWIHDSIVPLARSDEGRWSLVALQSPPTPAAIPDRLVFVEAGGVEREVVIPQVVPLESAGGAAPSATRQECIAILLCNVLAEPLLSAPDPQRPDWRQLKCLLKPEVAAQFGKELSVDLLLDSKGRLAECRVNLLTFEGVDYRVLDLVFPLPSFDVQVPAVAAAAFIPAVVVLAAVPDASAAAQPVHLLSCAPFEDLVSVEPGSLSRFPFTMRQARLHSTLRYRQKDFADLIKQWSKGCNWKGRTTAYVEALIAQFGREYRQGRARWIDTQAGIVAVRIDVGAGAIKELWLRIDATGVRSFELAPELPGERAQRHDDMHRNWEYPRGDPQRPAGAAAIPRLHARGAAHAQ
jgi:hypothetical protein